MASSGMLRSVALVRTDVSEEPSASIIRVTRIGELGTLAVTRNRRALGSWYGIQTEDAERSGSSRWWRGFVNDQTTKRGPKHRWKGWVGVFVNTLGMQNRVPKCPWVLSESFKEPIRGFHDLARQKPNSLLILLSVEFKLNGLPDNTVHISGFRSEDGRTVELNAVSQVDTVFSYDRPVRIF
jgi:hypothetical protein